MKTSDVMTIIEVRFAAKKGRQSEQQKLADFA
jgi:hypothetical protein